MASTQGSDRPISSGSITFDSIPCEGTDPGQLVVFSVDAILGAEDGGPDALEMRGSFAGPQNEPWSET